MRSHPRIPSLVIAASCVALSDAPGADADIEALKAQFQAQFNRLEKRIDTLEAENAQLKRAAKSGTVTKTSPEIDSMKRRITELETTASKPSSVVAANAQRSMANAAAIDAIEKKLQAGATETRDIFRDEGGWPFDVKKFYDLPQPFEFHGYLRSGFGMNDEGGKMEAFKAPGAGAKYRLGNENDTYGEIGLTHNWLRLDDPSLAPYVRSTVMVSYSSKNSFSYESLNNQAQGNDFALRQAYVEAGNVIQSAPDIKFWAGQRYYQRHDIHINDFYYLDMSGYGGGIEGVKLGDLAKLSLAWIGGSVDNYLTDHGNTAKQNIDLRLSDIKAPLGKVTLWFNYANTRGGEVRDVFNADGSKFHVASSSGWAVGLIHRTNEPEVVATAQPKDGKGVTPPAPEPSGGFLGGYNEFSIQYGEGAAYNFASTLDASGPNLGDAWRFRVTDHFTIQPSPKFAMQAVGIYEETKYGGPNSHERWVSLGIRPVWYFNDRFSIAVEAGVDWAKSEPLGTDGHLWKVTFAPQLARGGKFFSRPVVRPFVTYAKWSDGFKGRVGGTAYENATDGLSYGLQIEAWW